MEQKFHHYENWEDYKCGMYDELKDGREYRVDLAVHLLSNPDLCLKFMQLVVERWKIACEQVLTNKSINRKSWLGQAACCLYAGIKEDETRTAWWKLTTEQQNTANEIAKKVILEYEELFK